MNNNIIINGKKWKVIFVDGRLIKAEKAFIKQQEELNDIIDGNNFYIDGMCDTDRLELWYRTDINKGDRLKNVIRHELAHAMLYSQGVFREQYDQEFMCDWIASNIEQILILQKEVLDIYKSR